MKIAVTGGTGIVGSSLLKMRPADVDAVVISRSVGDDYPEHASNTKYLQSDYSLDSLINAFQGCDAVVHLAACRLQKNEPDKSFLNVTVDFNVFRAAWETGITNIVFTSSRGVYGNNPNVPWSEESQTMPDNPYSLSKLISEQTAAYFNRQGLSIKIFRLAQVLSAEAGRKYALGEFIEKSLNGEPIQLYATDEQKREYIYVKDVARALLAALNQSDVKGVFNLGSGEVITIPELAYQIHHIFDNPSEIIEREPRAVRKEHSLMDSSLFYSTFKFRIKWSIEEALYDIRNTEASKSR